MSAFMPRNGLQLSGPCGSSHKLPAELGPRPVWRSFIPDRRCFSQYVWDYMKQTKEQRDSQNRGKMFHIVWSDRRVFSECEEFWALNGHLTVCLQQYLCASSAPDTKCHWFTTFLTASWSRSLIGCVRLQCQRLLHQPQVLWATNIWSSNDVECAASTCAVSWKV